MSARPAFPPARRLAWSACFLLVFVAAFHLSGTRPPPLELDPSWHAAVEYAAVHHLQFGTQIVFTYGPLGFLATRTSLGKLVAARIVFALFWSAMVALAATTLARRLSGWIRYAFLAWLVILTLSEGLDPVAFLVMAYSALALIVDDARERWQSPFLVLACVILSLIKISFLTASLASLAIVVACWIGQGKILKACVLALGAPAAFVTGWAALGQSPSNLGDWFRHGWALQTGYSAAMNLAPKTAVLGASLAALALFGCCYAAMIRRAKGGITTAGVLITLGQYVFLAWKEGFTRSGDWHTYVFLWFLPLAWAFCFLPEFPPMPAIFPRWAPHAAFAAGMALCLVAANLQIAGFVRGTIADCPGRIAGFAETLGGVLTGRAPALYARPRESPDDPMLRLGRARDVIGSQSVDAMNYLLLAPIVNGLNYQPRPVIQGFVAYTPALQNLNAEYFRSSGRPRFVMLSQQATDGRFPALEDSAALNYVLDNYLPVASDGRFLILQQRTAEDPAFQPVDEMTVNFGDRVDLRRWAGAPLFMTAMIVPSASGRLVPLVYQPPQLFMRVAVGQAVERFRIVPSMAEQPFVVSPLLGSNYDVLNLYASRPGKAVESVTFEAPATCAFEYHQQIVVRLYTAAGFPHAAQGISVPRMLADVEGRVFWPEPQSLEAGAPASMMVFHGEPALLVHAPSKIVVEVPKDARAFTGYFGIPGEVYFGRPLFQSVEVSITIEDESGHRRPGQQQVLDPLSQAGDHGRFSFRLAIDGARDRTITLATHPVPPSIGEQSASVWSQCRFEK